MNKSAVCCMVCMAAASLLFFSCAGGARAAQGEAPPENPQADGVARMPPAGSGLANLAKLPPEARAYLERLAQAFAQQDTAFLLAQGEAQFEAETKARYDVETYLALLYRAGPYAEESPRIDSTLYRLNPAGIIGIEYLSWEEKGPLLEIQAQLFQSGKPALVPCRIMLVWRLREPKIEGLFL